MYNENHKTIGSLVLTAVLLTSVSPLTNANEIQTNNTKLLTKVMKI